MEFSCEQAVAYAHAAKAGTYRKVGTVTAHRLDGDHQWVTDSGSQLAGSLGYWQVSDGVSSWTVKPEVFAMTYRHLGDGVYRKSATVLLIRIDEPFLVDTLEGPSAGRAGDFLAVGPAGDAWQIPGAYVQASYMRVEPS